MLATLPLAAAAQDSIVVQIVTATTTYLNGGIGQSEENTMRRVAKEFPLRMTFSKRKDGEFLADVPVVISDMRGNPVFELAKAGPMLDLAGRVFKNVPTPLNLVIPPYRYLNDMRIGIGEDTAAK